MHSRVPEPVNAGETIGNLSTLDLVVRESDAQQSRVSANSNVSSVALPVPVIGCLVGFDETGYPLVSIANDNSEQPIPARSTLQLTASQLGNEVVLLFAGGDRQQPIIMGCLVPPVPADSKPTPPVLVELNGKRLELTAEDEIVLRCGKSSITLTQAGKILIRGEYLLSRSAGVNRIKGGSVQIN